MCFCKPVISIEKLRVIRDQSIQQFFCLAEFALHEQGFCQTKTGPGDCANIMQLDIDCFRLTRLPQRDVQLGTQSHEVDNELRRFAFACNTSIDRLLQAAMFHQLEYLHQCSASFQRTSDPFEQRIGGKRLEQIIGRRQLSGADDLRLRTFRSDHDEY